MAEEYAEKMPRKTDAELLLYLRNRAEYREDAVLAALEELTRRGHQPADAESIRAELQPVVDQQRQERQALEARRIAVEATPETLTTEAAGPALYSPGTIALFSMLISFLAGGALLVLNMVRLKESGKALRVVAFMIGFMVASSYTLQWLMQTYGPHLWFVSVVNLIAALTYLLYFWPQYVGPRAYVSRQWLPALLICLALVFGLYALVMPGLLK
ncbi:hypothetical protein [Hymenobacter elongatus]|uniref:Uncharacterized protein n=1 Tax=Hymenobacter elongatus TaxID=877208 RepID=A0A4Z0PJD1_9BACT|nr:hypothetical protein [Hymenobacter elongatus]TGE15647.1 hypothetical protein E5J99_11720 [Hymenobacter elongatus]